MLLRFLAIVLNCATQSRCLNASHFQWSFEAQLKYALLYSLPMVLLIPFLHHALLQCYHLLPTSIGCGCWGIGSGERLQSWPLWREHRVALCGRHLIASSCWTHCWTQMKPFSPVWGSLGKTYLERSKCCWGVRKKGWETTLWTLGGGAAADNRTEISLQLQETHQWSRWFSAASWEEHPKMYPHCKPRSAM